MHRHMPGALARNRKGDCAVFATSSLRCLICVMEASYGCAQEGVLALWKGWLPSVIGVVPYVGLNFAVYETSKDAILQYYGEASALLTPYCTKTRHATFCPPFHCQASQFAGLVNKEVPD